MTIVRGLDCGLEDQTHKRTSNDAIDRVVGVRYACFVSLLHQTAPNKQKRKTMKRRGRVLTRYQVMDTAIIVSVRAEDKLQMMTITSNLWNCVISFTLPIKRD